MLFRPREQQPFLHRVRSYLWPRRGLSRSARYMAHRLSRLPGSPSQIASGFACGAAISFTPFVGLHFVGGALIAFMIRGNVIASAVGTAIGNPWTFPIIWLWIYQLGVWILGEETQANALSQISVMFQYSMGYFWATLEDIARWMVGIKIEPIGSQENQQYEYLATRFWSVFWPMVVGGLPTALVAWVGFYLPVRGAVTEYQLVRKKRLAKRIQKKMDALHEQSAKETKKETKVESKQ
jgi:uncharacterized protein (DUF2062 family)